MSIYELGKKQMHRRTQGGETSLDAVLPMPKFGTTRSSEFAALVDPHQPHKIARDMTMRFSELAAMPSEHPAFKVALATLSQNPLANMTPLDWAWHREVLRRARLRDEARRVFNRSDFETYLQELNHQQQIRREHDKRAFHFAEAIKHRLDQSWLIERSNDRAIQVQRKMVERGLAIHDENKRTAFIMLYLKHFSPNRERTRRKTKELMTADSLTEQRIQTAHQDTPFEIVVQQARRMFPLLRQEEVVELFQKWQQPLNSVRIRRGESLVFQRTVSALFTKIFLSHQHGELLAERHRTAQNRNDNVYDRIHHTKQNVSFQLSRELAADHLRTLEHDREGFEQLIDQLDFSRLVTNTYNEQDLVHRKHQNKLATEASVTHRGITGSVPQDPIRHKTQFSLIKQWVNNVMILRDQLQLNFAEITDSQHENLKEDALQIRAHSLEGAVEFNRMMDAQRLQLLREQYTLEQIMRMFAATATAANMLSGYHTNTIPAHEASGTEGGHQATQVVAEVLQTTRSAKLTG